MPRSCTASASAAWSTTSPRAVLTKYDPGLSLSRTAASTRPRVSGVSARCTLSTSLRAATSSGDCSDVTSRSAACRARRRRRRRDAKRAAPDDDRHAERVRALRHLLADVAEPEQAERAAVQPARLRVLLLVPPARRAARRRCRECADRAPGSAQTPARRRRSAFLPGQFDDVDAAPRRGGDVDRVDAGAGADDQRQRARRRASARSPASSARPARRRRVARSPRPARRP